MALAQEPPGLGLFVEFPEIGALEVSAAEVEFDLSGANYPPANFPAYYEPTGPGSEDEPIILTVTSNSSSWRLEAAFSGLIMFDLDFQFQLPLEQLEYRVDGGEWFPFSVANAPIALALALPASGDSLADPESHTLELRLKVDGSEAPGSYEGTLVFSLTSQ